MTRVSRGEPLAAVLTDVVTLVRSCTRAGTVSIEFYSDEAYGVVLGSLPSEGAGPASPTPVRRAEEGADAWLSDEGLRLTADCFCSRARDWKDETGPDGRYPGDDWLEGDWLKFPIRLGDLGPVGCIAVHGTTDSRLLTSADIGVIGLLAGLASVALSCAGQRSHFEKVSEKLTQRTDLLEDLLKISSSIVSERGLGNLSNMILSSLATLFGFQRVSIIVFDESVGAFRWLALYGYPDDVTEFTLSRTIPTEVVLAELTPEYRIAPAVYHVPFGKITKTAKQYMVLPDETPSDDNLTSVQKELREGDTLAFPLHDAAGRIVGVIYPSMVRIPRPLDAELIETIGIFTSLAEVAMEDARLSAEREGALRLSSQRAEQLSRIFDLTSELMYVRDINQLLNDVLRSLAQLLGLKRMVIGLRDDDQRTFTVRAAYGFSEDALEKIKAVKYPRERVDYLIDPESWKHVDSPVKWRRKVGRRTYYMPAESIRYEPDDDLYLLDRERARHPRKSKDHWHELDYMDTFIMDRVGSVIAYIEILQPRDDRIPDGETIEVIEIFAGLVRVAIENARLFEGQVESRRAAEFYTDLLSHDIKNFNQAIMGYLDILGAYMTGDEQKAQIEKIVSQVMNVSRLASDVRTMSRLTWGEVSLAKMDLGAVLLDCVNSVQMYYLNRRISIAHAIEPERYYTRADELLRDLFTNLLTNAVKYDTHDIVEIEVSLERDGSAFTVSVADRGCGVPDELKESIFERFSKAPKKKGSSGLGLHIVSMLAKRYGGKVWVEDRVPGRRSEGSVFKVTLPEH